MRPSNRDRAATLPLMRILDNELMVHDALNHTAFESCATVVLIII